MTRAYELSVNFRLSSGNYLMLSTLDPYNEFIIFVGPNTHRPGGIVYRKHNNRAGGQNPITSRSTMFWEDNLEEKGGGRGTGTGRGIGRERFH